MRAGRIAKDPAPCVADELTFVVSATLDHIIPHDQWQIRTAPCAFLRLKSRLQALLGDCPEDKSQSLCGSVRSK